MNALDTAIKTLLSGDSGAGGVATLATGGIYQVEIPQGTAPPYVVFNELLDTANYVFGNVVAWDYVPYQIKGCAVDGNTSGPYLSGQIADRLRVLLTNPTMTVTGKVLVGSRFLRSIPPVKEWDDANKRFIHSKGIIAEIWLA